MKAKRDIFEELLEGVNSTQAERQRKITLRSYKREAKPLRPVSPAFIRKTRAKLKLSRGVFARKLVHQCSHSGELGTRPWKTQRSG